MHNIYVRWLNSDMKEWRNAWCSLVQTTQSSHARLPSCEYFDERAPCTIPYMPPEALVVDPHYNGKIDVFSLGVLMLETALQKPSSAGIF